MAQRVQAGACVCPQPLPLVLDTATVATVVIPLLAVAIGVWVFLDARSRGRGELAPYLGVVVAGLFLAGSLPGVVALLVAEDPAVQGFPTALRIVPGLGALFVYLYAR